VRFDLVHRTKPNGQADLQGVKEGWKIVELNGLPVTAKQCIEKLPELMKSRNMYTLTFESWGRDDGDSDGSDDAISIVPSEVQSMGSRNSSMPGGSIALAPRVQKAPGSIHTALSQISAQDSNYDDIDDVVTVTHTFSPFKVGVLFNTANNRVYALKPGEQGQQLNIGIGWRLLRMDGKEVTAKQAIMSIPSLRDRNKKFTMTFAKEGLERTEKENLEKIEAQIERQLEKERKGGKLEKDKTSEEREAATEQKPEEQPAAAEQEKPEAEKQPGCLSKFVHVMDMDYYPVKALDDGTQPDKWSDVYSIAPPVPSLSDLGGMLSFRSLFGFVKPVKAEPAPVAA